MASSCDIMFSSFYSVLARYLIEQGLVNKVEFDEGHLLVHEVPSDMDFEFTLSLKRIEGGW